MHNTNHLEFKGMFNYWCSISSFIDVSTALCRQNNLLCMLPLHSCRVRKCNQIETRTYIYKIIGTIKVNVQSFIAFLHINFLSSLFTFCFCFYYCLYLSSISFWIYSFKTWHLDVHIHFEKWKTAVFIDTNTTVMLKLAHWS